MLGTSNLTACWCAHLYAARDRTGMCCACVHVARKSAVCFQPCSVRCPPAHTTTKLSSLLLGSWVVRVRLGCAACVCGMCVPVTLQLAEVYWVEGLGPSQVELWTLPDSGTPTGAEGVEEDDTHTRPATAAAAAAGAAGTHARNSFADQVGPNEGCSKHFWSGSWLDLRPAAAVTSVVLGWLLGSFRGAHGGYWLPLCTTAPCYLRQASGGHALVWSSGIRYATGPHQFVLPPAS